MLTYLDKYRSKRAGAFGARTFLSARLYWRARKPALRLANKQYELVLKQTCFDWILAYIVAATSPMLFVAD